MVIAAGGDGTLHGVVNGVVGGSATVAQIPLGTGNDFARAVGIPIRPAEAAGVLASGRAALVDLGRVGNRLFINAAGCGFDAAVAERVNRGFRSLGGASAYIAAVIATLFRYRATAMTITVDGQSIARRAMLCAVANGTGYGGGMRIAPEARWDDGLLDVCIVAECSRIEFLRAFPQVFRGVHTHHPKVQMLRGKRVTVESDPPVGVLVDGEIAGTTPVILETVPGAIRFVVP
jgi:diacylglycerol kinase (ATP)